MDSSIWERVSSFFDNALKYSFRRTEGAAHVVYVWPSSNMVADDHLRWNDLDRVYTIATITNLMAW